MGYNNGSTAPPTGTQVSNVPEEGVFRFRVVEHISWDAYDEDKKCFLAGLEHNKPIVGRIFKIKMPNGSVIDKTTDKNGVIEFAVTDTNAKFDVIFEPENATLNNKYHLFYNRCTLVEKKL
jgi:hypothetical protein